MGQAANVPIEPDEQTVLLDKCLQLQGVLGGGVPGGESISFTLTLLMNAPAGGYDALYLLVLTPPARSEEIITAVEELWRGWSDMSVQPLSSAARVEGPNLRADTLTAQQGLSAHNLDDVAGLRSVLR